VSCVMGVWMCVGMVWVGLGGVGGLVGPLLLRLHLCIISLDHPSPPPQHNTTQQTDSPPAYAFISFEDLRDAEDAVRGR
jgi:hypothetical protein